MDKNAYHPIVAAFAFFLLAPCLPASAQTVAVAESATIVLPGGTFTMGSPNSEVSRYDNETPHLVMVGAFSIGKYEVTQAEWTAVMGANPSKFKGERNPVETVSWYDTLVYCNKLSMKESRTPCYSIKGEVDPDRWGRVPKVRDADWDAVSCDWNANGYRLPTEAEWEYACRAGTTTPFNTGNNITTDQANYDGNYPYEGYAKGTSRKRTLPVGSFAANAFGLYDTHGNVWEWCWDWFGVYGGGSQNDPQGSTSPVSRIRRGGSWDNSGRFLRSDYRLDGGPWGKTHYIGFRLVVRP